MRKIVAAILLCDLALTAGAVPAKRGWQTRTQADGTIIEVQQMGDEYYHYLVNRDGKQVCEINGMFEVVGDKPTAAVAKARRAKAQKLNIRKAKQEFGVTPNLAPRGIVIMVNFSDQSFQTAHTRIVIDSLCNAVNCTVNKSGNVSYPSAGQYFKDQSNGAYAPVFDVYGPVTMSHNVAYYGANDVAGNDIRPANMLVEACKKANTQFNVDFTRYDSDNDGKIDFVYIIYAGKGEASGGSENTIWPHSYSVSETIEYDEYFTSSQGAAEWEAEYGEAYVAYFSNEYSLSDCYVDGKLINTYACSNELSGNSLDGIGTLCHEFGHVMGLPDFYDTNYEDNYKNAVTPNDWDVMDGGAYNGDGHCPPNYSPWEKYFFGWHTPVNLGSESQNLTLYANGTSNYQAYQINTSGKQQTATTAGECYYIENRQSVGWDRELPHHGLLIWKVNYNQSKWKDNKPNNTSGSPLYTLVSASGTKIGTHPNSNQSAYVDDGPKNPYPGSANVTSKTIAGKPLLNIAESNKIITLTYIEEPQGDPFDIVWMSNGTQFTTTTSTGKVVLPTSEPAACSGKVFVGWCATADYSSDDTAPTFVKAGDAVAEGATFYAVFAATEEGGTASVVATMVAANQGYENQQDVTAVTMDNCTLTFSKAGGSNAPKYYTTGSAIRCYKNNTLTISSTNSITSVVFTTVNGYDGVITASEGSYSNGTWTGSANEVTFTNAPSDNSQWRIVSIQVTTGGGVSYSAYTTTCSGETPEPVYYTIRFFDNGTQLGESQSVLKNQQAQVPADPTPECDDYTFVGWWTEGLNSDNTEAKTWVTNFKATKNQDYYAIYSKIVISDGSQAVEESLAFVGLGKDNQTDVNNEEIIIGNHSTITFAKGTGSVSPKYLTTGTAIRAYGGNTVTVAADANMSLIEFTFDSGEGTNAISASTGTYDDGTWTGDAASVVFTIEGTSGHRRFKTVTVTIGTAAGYTTYYTSVVNCNPSDVETIFVEETALKVLRDGQLVIIRGEEVYTITGVRIQ